MSTAPPSEERTMRPAASATDRETVSSGAITSPAEMQKLPCPAVAEVMAIKVVARDIDTILITYVVT